MVKVRVGATEAVMAKEERQVYAAEGPVLTCAPRLVSISLKTSYDHGDDFTVGATEAGVATEWRQANAARAPS